MKTKQYSKILMLGIITSFLFAGKCSEEYGYEEFENLLETINYSTNILSNV